MRIGKFYANRIGGEFVAGWDAGDQSRMRRDLGWDKRTPRDEESLVQDGTRELIRLKLSDLRRNNPVVAGVGLRMARFLVGPHGVNPQLHTTDKAWNKSAEQFWSDYGKSCDSRGRLDMRAIQALAVSLRPVHGGIYLERLANGQVRPIECERIRQPIDGKRQREFNDGVKIDHATGRILQYCIHARDEFGAFGASREVSYRSADVMMPFTAPPWRLDQVRELPDLAPIVPALQDVGEMLKYTLNTAKSQSELVAFLKKGSAGPSNMMPRGRTIETAGGKRQTWDMEWGQVMEGQPGDDLVMLTSASPGANHMPYVDFWLKLCAAAMDFPYEFLSLDFSKADWSRMRGILLMINHALRPHQARLADWMNNWWAWRVGRECLQGGALYPCPVDARGIPEYMRVEWQSPEELWLDRQETAQADILEYGLGQTTLAKAAKRHGVGDLHDILVEKAKELQDARQIEKDHDLPEGTLIKAIIPGQQEKTTAQRDADMDRQTKDVDDEK
jgi:capsid protein